MKGWFHWTTQERIVDLLEQMAERILPGRKRIALDPCSNAEARTRPLVELWGGPDVAVVPYRQIAELMVERSHAETETMGTFTFRPDWARRVHPEERAQIIIDAARSGLAQDHARLDGAGRHVLLEDGLRADWKLLAGPHGLVYMNPPFGTGVVDSWVDTAATWGERNVDVVGMVANATAARWFHEHVFARCSAGLFIRGRLAFDNAPPDSKNEGASIQNVLVHWGPSVQAFMETFQGLGELFSMRASKQQMQWRCVACDAELERVPEPNQEEAA